MDRLEFENGLSNDGFKMVHSSQKPNTVSLNHCHDFDARLYVLGGEITITRDNHSETFRAGDCCEVPAGCMHAERTGPEGVAFISGRRRNGGPLSREAFESDLRREGYEVFHGGHQPNHRTACHARGTFDVRIMVLGGEITLIRDGGAETFTAGGYCDIPAECMHCEVVGPEGAAYIAGKLNRQPMQ